MEFERNNAHGAAVVDYRSAAVEAANRNGIPPELFLKLVGQESGFNSNALSPKGASGLAQLMPGTAADLGVDPNDPMQNLEGGARYLRQQFEEFGDWELALAAYNAGPGAVKKYGGIPPYDETQDYVAKIYGGGSDYGGNALSGYPQGGQSRPDPNALAALLEPKKPEVPQLWQGHDPAMFQNRGRFA